MRFSRLIAHRLHSLFRPSRANAELQSEIELHLEQLVKEAMASGMSESEARLAARRQFGSVETTKEECRDKRRVNLIDDLIHDVRYALRMIRARPGFSVPALLSLALGIGGNIVIFSVVDGILIRPLPYADPERLVGVFNSAVFPGQVVPNWPLSLNMYAAYQENARSFEEFGVWTPNAAAVTSIGDPEQVATVYMTHGVLRALEVNPYLGRSFSSADETEGAQKTVILSYKYWQRKFGGDARVLGRIILIDFAPYEVIGVLPQNFAFLNQAPEVFLAQRVAVGAPGSTTLIARASPGLKPGISVVQANHEMARLLSHWGTGRGISQQTLEELRVKPNIHSLKQDVVGDIGATLKILMGVLAMVLLLVCANVANLIQVRAQARHDEFAIRAARALVGGESGVNS